MKEEVIFRMESAYREDFEVKVITSAALKDHVHYRQYARQ